MPRTPLTERVDKETLERLYWQHGLTSDELAERYGSHRNGVIRLMRKYGIPRRGRGGRKKSG